MDLQNQKSAAEKAISSKFAHFRRLLWHWIAAAQPVHSTTLRRATGKSSTDDNA